MKIFGYKIVRGDCPGDQSPNASKARRESTFWRIILWTAGIYVLAIFLVSLSKGQGVWGVLSILGPIVAVGAAFAVIGALFGFLFGMPKAFSRAVAPGVPPLNVQQTGKLLEDTTSVALGASRSHQIEDAWANNNLVEVSDWLTKIVVGIGLIQIQEIIEWTGSVGKVIGAAVSLPSPMDEVVGVSVILLNTGLGFFVMYIYARTLLTIMFASVSDEVNSRLEGDIDSLQASSDASIAAAVDRIESIERSLKDKEIPIARVKPPDSTIYSEEEKYQKLKESLRSSNFTWRTFKRLAVETGIETEKEVGEILAKFGKGEIKTSIGKKGNRIAQLEN